MILFDSYYPDNFRTGLRGYTIFLFRNLFPFLKCQFFYPLFFFPVFFRSVRLGNFYSSVIRDIFIVFSIVFLRSRFCRSVRLDNFFSLLIRDIF